MHLVPNPVVLPSFFLHYKSTTSYCSSSVVLFCPSSLLPHNIICNLLLLLTVLILFGVPHTLSRSQDSVKHLIPSRHLPIAVYSVSSDAVVHTCVPQWSHEETSLDFSLRARQYTAKLQRTHVQYSIANAELISSR